MAKRLPRQRLSDASLVRLDRVMRKVEGETSREPSLPGIDTPAPVAERFVLLSTLSQGRFAAAKRLVRSYLEGGDPDQYIWVPSASEYLVYGMGQNSNHYPEGAHVTCVMTSAGWCVIDSNETTVLPEPKKLKEAGVNKLEPFMVFATDGLSTEYKGARKGIIPEKSGLLAQSAHWKYSYQVLCGDLGESYTPENSTGTPSALQKKCLAVPTVSLPGLIPTWNDYRYGYEAERERNYVRCAYEKFDGKMTNGSMAPTVIRDRFGTDKPPQANQLWGPGRKGKLTRAFTAIELFWWELRTSGDYTAQSRTVHVWEGLHPDHQAYLDTSWRGHTGTAVDQIWPPYTDTYWISDCTQTNSGVLASNPKPDAISRFFVAPWGYWEDSRWGSAYSYSWYWDNYAYNPYWNAYYPGAAYGWYGPWGGWNYWGGYWGGFPPTASNSFGTTTNSQPPQPPCGDLLQRYRFGFVMWEYGWLVASDSVDEDRNTCLVTGPLQIRNSVIDENATVPSPTPL